MNAFKHLLLLTTLMLTTLTQAAENGNFEKLPPLKNFQVNTENMVSSGLPSKPHFDVFKAQGVTTVIDLIPGDRSEEREIVLDTGLAYENVQVVWDNPTLENFQEYVGYMQQAQSREGTTLTHCKLNWRGAVFTYLYRVTQLGQPEAEAKADLDAIWQPNETWQAFIDTVKAHYQVS